MRGGRYECRAELCNLAHNAQWSNAWHFTAAFHHPGLPHSVEKLGENGRNGEKTDKREKKRGS